MYGSDGNDRPHSDRDAGPSALDSGRFDPQVMTQAEREAVTEAGARFADAAGGVWMLISGRFVSSNGTKGTEELILEQLRHAFGYPDAEPGRTINVLLNSPGGSLDSAYSTVLNLSAYAGTLNVYVPDVAKSASTLLAVGADTVYLSAFGQLGPLDTQIPDPRNPANTVSALDCYQSVDYVRDFGYATVKSVLPQLVSATERRISISELIDTATTFALGAIDPVLKSVTALDFGGWGRSLRIGEQYAKKLLQDKAKDGEKSRAYEIADQLVYGYPHHLFPIDYKEAKRIGLRVEWMDRTLYDGATKVLDACHRKTFVGLLSQPQSRSAVAPSGNGHPAPTDRPVQFAPEDRPHADTGSPRAFDGTPGTPGG